MCKSISIHSLLLQKDWEGALSLAEDDPEQAKEWFFGVDDQLDPSIDEIPESECEVWKRLALHIACAYRAPVGLVEVLLHANPDGATSCDPRSGDLPIHLACQHKASYRVIKALLNHSPITTKAVNSRGHSPLHHAVLAKAHYAVIELLVQTDPESILATDQDEQTPLELARKAYGRNSIIVRLLEMVKLVLEKPTKQSTIGHHDTADF